MKVHSKGTKIINNQEKSAPKSRSTEQAHSKNQSLDRSGQVIKSLITTNQDMSELSENNVPSTPVPESIHRDDEPWTAGRSRKVESEEDLLAVKISK